MEFPPHLNLCRTYLGTWRYLSPAYGDGCTSTAVEINRGEIDRICTTGRIPWCFYFKDGFYVSRREHLYLFTIDECFTPNRLFDFCRKLLGILILKTKDL